MARTVNSVFPNGKSRARLLPPDPMRDRILITGPGGRVGTQIVPLLREHFALRLLDASPLKSIQLAGDDEFVQADIRDLRAVREACDGVKAMIHLAAISDEDDFDTKLLPINLAVTPSKPRVRPACAKSFSPALARRSCITPKASG